MGRRSPGRWAGVVLSSAVSCSKAEAIRGLSGRSRTGLAAPTLTGGSDGGAVRVLVLVLVDCSPRWQEQREEGDDGVCGPSGH